MFGRKSEERQKGRKGFVGYVLQCKCDFSFSFLFFIFFYFSFLKFFLSGRRRVRNLGFVGRTGDSLGGFTLQEGQSDVANDNWIELLKKV